MISKVHISSFLLVMFCSQTTPVSAICCKLMALQDWMYQPVNVDTLTFTGVLQFIDYNESQPAQYDLHLTTLGLVKLDSMLSWKTLQSTRYLAIRFRYCNLCVDSASIGKRYELVVQAIERDPHVSQNYADSSYREYAYLFKRVVENPFYVFQIVSMKPLRE